MVLVAMECCHRAQHYAATGGIPEELLILPPSAIQSCHLIRSGLDCQIPLFRGGMATPVGATGSKVRIARDSGGIRRGPVRQLLKVRTWADRIFYLFDIHARNVQEEPFNHGDTTSTERSIPSD